VRLKSKMLLAALGLTLGIAPAFAQAPQQDSPSDQSQGPGGFGPGGPRRMGPDGPKGDWGGGWGQRDGGEWGHRRGRGMGQREFGLARLLNNPEIRQQIGVSDEQAAKIRQQEFDFRKAEIRDRANLQVQRLDLRELLSADKPDHAAIDSKLQEMSNARLTMEKAAVNYRLSMRDALTPEQRQKLHDWMQQHRKGESGHARGMRRGGPGARGMRGGAPGPKSGAPPAPNSQNPTPDEQPE